MKHGYGKLFVENEIYEGYFKGGMKHGNGMMRRYNKNGGFNEYVGKFRNDKKEGFGFY